MKLRNKIILGLSIAIIVLLVVFFLFITNYAKISKVIEEKDKLSTTDKEFISTVEHLKQIAQVETEAKTPTQYSSHFEIRSGPSNNLCGYIKIPCNGYNTLKITAVSYIQESDIYTWTHYIKGIKDDGSATNLISRNNKTNNGVSISYTFDISDYSFFEISSSSAHSSYWTGNYTLIP